jgi:hypothetical protein
MVSSVPAPAAPAIVRSGSKLIFPAPLLNQAVDLPPLCVRCGAPAIDKPLKKTFYWHHRALYILLLSPIIYAIVAVIVRKSMKVNVPLCLQHARRRSNAIIFAWLIPVIGIADIFILPKIGVDPGVIALITTACIITGLVIWAVVANPIRPTSIDKYYGEFSGFCEIFLQQFPQGSPQAPVLVAQQFPQTQQGPPPPPPSIR